LLVVGQLTMNRIAEDFMCKDAIILLAVSTAVIASNIDQGKAQIISLSHLKACIFDDFNTTNNITRKTNMI
jgi:hypothetical protein